MAALLGMLTGIGGGMVRDVLLAQVPMVLRSDLYAVAALAGAAVVAIGSHFGLAPAVTALAGALVCFRAAHRRNSPRLAIAEGESRWRRCGWAVSFANGTAPDAGTDLVSLSQRKKGLARKVPTLEERT